jgi:hypothetical protein
MDWTREVVGDKIAEAIFNIHVKLLDGVNCKRDVSPDIEIDYENLEKQLSEGPSIYAFWSTILAEQKMNVAILEMEIKRCRGKIVDNLVKGVDDRKKLRASDIKELIEADDGLLKLQAKYIKEERTLSKLYAITKALEMKAENMRSLFSLKRREMDMTQ